MTDGLESRYARNLIVGLRVEHPKREVTYSPMTFGKNARALPPVILMMSASE